MGDVIGHVLILGCGYVGERLAAACLREGIQVSGTTRSEERARALQSMGLQPVVVSSPLELSEDLLAKVDAIVDSIPLCRSESGTHAPQLDWLPDLAPKLTRLRWAGYLSTTGVYGDAAGAWVDETWPCRPQSLRGIERLKAESCWLGRVACAEVFRIAGIYGPGRNMIERLRAGGYRAVAWNPPRYSNRIHVDDIVAALLAAMSAPVSGRIVNLADDEPLPHVEYVAQLAEMIDAPPPVLLTPEEGEVQLSPSVLDFFRDNKRVSNRLLHDQLLAQLRYPTFRDGLRSLL